MNGVSVKGVPGHEKEQGKVKRDGEEGGGGKGETAK